MSFDAGSIVSKLILDKKGFDASVKVVKKGVKDLGKYVDTNSAKIKHMGRTMTIAGGAIVGAFGLAVKSAISFNKQMANVATLVPNSTKRILELKEGVQDLAMETGKSTKDISDGLYQVISAFGDTAETAEILETNVLAAAAGMATTTDAIYLTSAVMKGYGDVSSESTKKVADLAFQTVKLGQTTFPELARSMGRAIPVAAKLGVTQEELFAGFATLTGVTGDATMVTTQLFAAMNSIMKPSTDMAKAISKLGYTSAETMVKELGLVGSMRALVKTTDGSVESVGKLVPNIRALPAVFALTGGQAEVFDQKLIKMNDSAGAMDEAFKEMSEGINKTGFNMSQLGQMTSVLTQRIGDSLAPVLGDLVLSAGKIVTKLSEWIKEHPKLTAIIAKATVAFGALMVALGPLMMALPGLIKALPLVRKGFLKLVPSLATLKSSVSGVSGLLKSLPAVAMAAFAGWEVGKAIGKIELLGKSINEHLVDGFSNAIDNLGLFQSKAELTGETTEKLAGRVKFLAEYKQKLADMAKKTTTAIVELNDKGLEPLGKTITEVSEIIVNDFGRAGRDMSDVIEWMGTSIQATAIPAMRDLAGVAYNVQGSLQDLTIGEREFLEETKNTTTKAKSLWEDMADGLQTKWASTMGEVLRGATSIKDGLKGVWDGVVVQFTDMLGQLISKFATDFVGGIISGASKAGSAISTLAGGAASLGSAITGLATGVASILPAIAKGVAAAAKILFGALPHILAIGAAAIALYAGFMAVKALFGSGGGGGAGDYTNKLLETMQTQLNGINLKLDSANWHNAKFQTGFKSIIDVLHDIRKATEGTVKALTKKGTVYVDVFRSGVMDNLGRNIAGGISGLGNNIAGSIGRLGNNIEGGMKDFGKNFSSNKDGGSDFKGKKFAEGFEGVVNQPMMALMGEAGPEDVSIHPVSERGKSKPSSNVTVYNTVNLNGTIITDRDYTRQRMLPEILSALKANFEKTKMKEILGIT